MHSKDISLEALLNTVNDLRQEIAGLKVQLQQVVSANKDLEEQNEALELRVIDLENWQQEHKDEHEA